jgi:hypothetical protein
MSVGDPVAFFGLVRNNKLKRCLSHSIQPALLLVTTPGENMANSNAPAGIADVKPATKRKRAAKGKRGNRSAAIRDELAKNPKATSTEIVASLAKNGIKVTPKLIYIVKSRQHKAKKKVKRTQVAEMSQKTASHNPVELVLRVKDMAREVGGIANLKKLVDLLAE